MLSQHLQFHNEVKNRIEDGTAFSSEIGSRLFVPISINLYYICLNIDKEIFIKCVYKT